MTRDPCNPRSSAEIGQALRSASTGLLEVARDRWRHTAHLRRDLLDDQAGATEADREAERLDAKLQDAGTGDLDSDRCLAVDEGVECRGDLDDGEGYDGECGRHATLRYLEEVDLDEDGL